MKRPKSPCSQECPDRKTGCHSECCPHGWGAYEKAYQEYMLEQQREKRAIQEADEYKQGRIRKALRKKGGGKYLPIR